MSSGFGLRGNTGRCYQYFEDFASCMKENSDGGEQQLKCRPRRDDYLECLHHKKEVKRVETIAAEAERQANGGSDGGGSGH